MKNLNKLNQILIKYNNTIKIIFMENNKNNNLLDNSMKVQGCKKDYKIKYNQGILLIIVIQIIY